MAYLSKSNIDRLLDSIGGIDSVYSTTDNWINKTNKSYLDSFLTSHSSNNTAVSNASNDYSVTSSLDDLHSVTSKASLNIERLTEMVLSLEGKVSYLNDRLETLYRIVQADIDEKLLSEEKRDDSVFLEFFDRLDE